MAQNNEETPGVEFKNGEARIEGEYIIIRVPITLLDSVLDGAWAINSWPVRYRTTDNMVFAKELCYALNNEDEQGTTCIHKMFDSAIDYAIEQGCEGVTEHEDQDA